MFDQIPNLWGKKKRVGSLHVVIRDLFDAIILSCVSSGSEVGEGMGWGTELSQVGQRGTRCRDAQGWGLDVRATVLD